MPAAKRAADAAREPLPKRRPSTGKPRTEASADQLIAERRRLPMWRARAELLEVIAGAPSVVVTAETGSGKTTQIPQFLHAAGYTSRGTIAITQPRRVAAITVARRVAAEMGASLGGLVGYCVRFDDKSCAATKVRYLTDGMLLREACADPSLKRYAVVIVDEVHERSLQTDILLGVAKRAQAPRGRCCCRSGRCCRGDRARPIVETPFVSARRLRAPTAPARSSSSRCPQRSTCDSTQITSAARQPSPSRAGRIRWTSYTQRRGRPTTCRRR